MGLAVWYRRNFIDFKHKMAMYNRDNCLLMPAVRNNSLFALKVCLYKTSSGSGYGYYKIGSDDLELFLIVVNAFERLQLDCVRDLYTLVRRFGRLLSLSYSDEQRSVMRKLLSELSRRSPWACEVLGPKLFGSCDLSQIEHPYAQKVKDDLSEHKRTSFSVEEIEIMFLTYLTSGSELRLSSSLMQHAKTMLVTDKSQSKLLRNCVLLTRRLLPMGIERFVRNLWSNRRILGVGIGFEYGLRTKNIKLFDRGERSLLLQFVAMRLANTGEQLPWLSDLDPADMDLICDPLTQLCYAYLLCEGGQAKEISHRFPSILKATRIASVGDGAGVVSVVFLGIRF